jgi:hypothetical protein
VESEEQERRAGEDIHFHFWPANFFFLRKIEGFLADKTSEILLTIKGLVHI